MGKYCYHASIEGAQHGAKSLDQFLSFANDSGASGAQPSNYLLESDGGFKSVSEIKETFEKYELKLDGISAHCPFWVHTTAWTNSPTIKPFLSEDVASKSADEIEAWAEDYILGLLELCGELGVKILPMFWGTAYGWEIASGYPWGFWAGPGYDLIKEGDDRFASKTAKIRAKANELGIYLAHEIHPGTGAMTADDFLHIVDVCDGDKTLTVNADPSHCWEGEEWESRFRKVGDRVVAAHVKNFVIREGFPLRGMKSDWPDRAMQFVDLGSGDLHMVRYVEMLMNIGYPSRYCKIMGTETAPLVVEAESAYRDLDDCSADGISYTASELVYPIAEGSFEDGMGA